MTKTTSQPKTDFSDFKTRLQNYKQLIDNELEEIAKEMRTNTAEQFGNIPSEVVKAYTDVLLRGGKRIRGALAIATYEMFGGNEQKQIVKAAAALEMFNTYILVADDIQDRSATRRGDLTAHTYLKDLHESSRLKGDAEHFGVSLAINSFLIAMHYASNVILSLDVNSDVKLKALENINKCFIVTAHGQTMDIYNEAAQATTLSEVNKTLRWKTAYYTFIDPMQLGAIMAGAETKELKELEDYGLTAGRTFQITDDIIGTFGKEEATGKSTMDDVKEGKRTLLVAKALSDSSEADAYFVESVLGKQDLTTAEFEKCKSIIVSSGALDYAKKEASDSAKLAVKVVERNTAWSQKHADFLIDLVNYLLVRQS